MKDVDVELCKIGDKLELCDEVMPELELGAIPELSSEQ